MSTRPLLPYFDFILAMLNQGNLAVEESFGRHVHFGYWPHQRTATGSNADYGRAAERLSLELCQAARVGPGDRVLDVGCGFGGTVALLNERYRGVQLVGLNLESRQLDRARKIVRPFPDNVIEWQQADACDLPFEDGSFDRVLAVECIFHFSSRRKFLREVHRVLRPGGTAALSDFVPAAPFQPLAKAITGSPHLARFQYFGRCDLSFTISTYRRVLRDLGFQVLAERNITRNVQPTYMYLKKLLSHAAAIEGVTGTVVHFMDALRLAGALRLLNYYLIAFSKPDNVTPKR